MKADWKTITVDYSDFDRAVQEVVPQFGQKNNEEISNLCRNGLIAYGPSFDGIKLTIFIHLFYSNCYYNS